MIIQKLNIQNFKNHTTQTFEFSPEINCFVGNNGVGKTNILDALHYLSLGKSFLSNSDANNIKNEEDFFTIEAEVEDEDKVNVLKITQSKEGKKQIKKNDKTYARMADHIGFLPSVMISPYDSNLISDSGESRRKFLDAIISQINTEYLHNIIQYHKILKQRNSLLKNFAKNRCFDAETLEIYDAPLEHFGYFIFNERKLFIERLEPIFCRFYEIISDGKEKVNIRYESHLTNTKMKTLLEENLQKDCILTYTSKGIHKDDLIFEMNNTAIKKVGSQGQQKSFLIALKLAQMNLIKELTHKTPLLLLDDIFDKLDDHRVAQLIELVNKENFGQIFITDTHRERTEAIVKTINEDSKVFEII